MQTFCAESVKDGVSPGSVGIEKYVFQLEQRIVEQQQLIKLLTEKITSLEAENLVGNKNKVVHSSSSQSSFNDVLRFYSGKSKEKETENRPSFSGSRASSICSVPSVKYCHFFVSRIDPIVTAEMLAQDILSTFPKLSYLRCVKLRTRFSSYASFHVTFPGDFRDSLTSTDSWPQGSLVKVFSGRLLRSHILHEFSTSVPPILTSQSASSVADNYITRGAPETTPVPNTNKNFNSCSQSSLTDRNSVPNVSNKVTAKTSKVSTFPNVTPKSTPASNVNSSFQSRSSNRVSVPTISTKMTRASKVSTLSAVSPKNLRPRQSTLNR